MYEAFQGLPVYISRKWLVGAVYLDASSCVRGF